MGSERGRGKKHFFLEGYTSTENYRPPPQGFGRSDVSRRDRRTHGGALLGQIKKLHLDAKEAREAQERFGFHEDLGLQVEFKGFPDVDLAFERLAQERFGIELQNVRTKDTHTYATVFVPDGMLKHIEKKIDDYLREKKDRIDRPRDNRPLIDTIQQIRAASLEAFWTDDQEFFPSDEEEQFWWEAWLPVRGNRAGVVDRFRKGAEYQEIRVASGQLEFPERTVLLMYLSASQIKKSSVILNSVAELRRAKETAQFFDDLATKEQVEWFRDLQSRIQYSSDGPEVPYTCLIDTGVNRRHPLIEPATTESDMHSIEPRWGTGDSDGHGTSMAGLALAGNLTEFLDGNENIRIDHRLESVKILPRDGADVTIAPNYGHHTEEAVLRSEITAPTRKRVFGLSITARDNRDRGSPSAWSAALDSLVAGGDDDQTGRLIAVAAGNVRENSAWLDYPSSNTSDGIHDPGQAWNVLTVGAYTDLVRISEADSSNYVPIAQSGSLSPFSTTSVTWDQQWPLKPDVVLEGGNVARESNRRTWTTASLSLLTTHYRPDEKLFTVAHATSAATALASRLAAQVMAVYPSLWPETIRALMVHSAEWTDAMKELFLPSEGEPSKRDYCNLVRHCGFGVPNLGRAVSSVGNSLTMVVEEILNPFEKKPGRDPSFREMNFHQLPWPINALRELGEVTVEMRVTLSYFIEPSPSRRGPRSRYRYASHGLRFDVKRQTENATEFRKRINMAAREREDFISSTDDNDWLIGRRLRHRGSLHADIWRGTAADLAGRGLIAVFPSTGWWRTRPRQERYNRSSRYALVVSIRAPEVDVDLYTEVANLVDTEIEIEA